MALLVAAACMVAVLGLVDDVRFVSPLIRLQAEVSAAVVAFAAGCRTDIGPESVDLVVTVAAIVLVTNSFNLLDNMDGALGSIVVVVALALGAAALLEGQYLVGGLALALAGASLGFLLHNWHPASIFMGDAGSLFLGFLLAALTLRLRTDVDAGASAVAAALLVGPALFDTTLVVISRLRAGTSLLEGGTDHTSHRLVRLGLGTRAAVSLIVVGSAVTSGLGVGVARGVLPPLPVLTLSAAVGLGLLAVLLRQPTQDPQPGEGAGRLAA